MSRSSFVGIDFGTTNSAVAVAHGDGRCDLMPMGNGEQTFRSILFFDSEDRGPDRRPKCYAGQAAIDIALDPTYDGRLVQSIKSYLANSGFSGTTVYGSRYALSDLVSLVLSQLIANTKAQIGEIHGPVVAGRPAEFVGTSEQGAEDLALTRLRDAYGFAGLKEVEFEFEPVAAAYSYASRLTKDERVLIADFGGGTSDFCLLTVGPSIKESAAQQEAIIAVDGVAVAGDAFDARIVENCVAPRLGRGSDYTAPSGKTLPMPNWVYDQLKAWHKLSFINNPRTHAILNEVIEGSQDPSAVSALKKLIAENLGFRLYRAVEYAKHTLSTQPEALLALDIGPVQLHHTIKRRDFEQWIDPELASIATCVDRILSDSSHSYEQVDRVFMTGGSSFLPAVRKIFEERFGSDKIRGGEELTSVASGLALVAQDRYGK